MRHNKGNEASARYSHQVELVEPEMVRERIDIRGNAAGLRASRRIGQAFAPAAAIEGDDTIALPSEGGRLGLPGHAGASVGMQQHDRDAGASGVGEP